MFVKIVLVGKEIESDLRLSYQFTLRLWGRQDHCRTYYSSFILLISVFPFNFYVGLRELNICYFTLQYGSA